MAMTGKERLQKFRENNSVINLNINKVEDADILSALNNQPAYEKTDFVKRCIRKALKFHNTMDCLTYEEIKSLMADDEITCVALYTHGGSNGFLDVGENYSFIDDRIQTILVHSMSINVSAYDDNSNLDIVAVLSNGTIAIFNARRVQEDEEEEEI